MIGQPPNVKTFPKIRRLLAQSCWPQTGRRVHLQRGKRLALRTRGAGCLMDPAIQGGCQARCVEGAKSERRKALRSIFSWEPGETGGERAEPRFRLPQETSPNRGPGGASAGHAPQASRECRMGERIKKASTGGAGTRGGQSGRETALSDARSMSASFGWPGPLP